MKDKQNSKLGKIPSITKRKSKKNKIYDYEFSDDIKNDMRNTEHNRSANLDDAFSYPGYEYDEEYGRDYTETTNRLKRKHQENLRQNYGIEFSDDEKVNRED